MWFFYEPDPDMYLEAKPVERKKTNGLPLSTEHYDST
jgi:hypothetical protein